MQPVASAVTTGSASSLHCLNELGNCFASKSEWMGMETQCAPQDNVQTPQWSPQHFCPGGSFSSMCDNFQTCALGNGVKCWALLSSGCAQEAADATWKCIKK